MDTTETRKVLTKMRNECDSYEVGDKFDCFVRDREKKQLWISEAYRALEYALEQMENPDAQK